MVFKLVRVDTEDPFKIELPLGTQLIGRGRFLDCDDKRVSRQHGKIEVTGDTLNVQALHTNPCFYTKKGMDETQILKQNCTVNLSHGDKFGLLPNTFWYELLLCSELDGGQSPDRTDEENTQPIDLPEIKTEQSENRMDVTADNEAMNCDTTVTESGSDSQSLLPAVGLDIGSPSLTPREASPVRQGVKSPSDSATVADDQSQTQVTPASDTENPASPSLKRCHSSENAEDDVKKVKEEPNDADVKQDPDATPGPSDQGPSANPGPGVPPSPAIAPNAAPLGRERCIYGASCYRKNPQHKAQFSHPCDADWGAGPRGVCPFGAACTRRDPRHWSAHQHPPGVAPPPPHIARGRHTIERHGNIFYITAHRVNIYEDHFEVADSDGESVDYDYEF